MAKTSLSNIKNWFKTGLKPTQQQFWDTWDSFWHKGETIPAQNIEGLADLLNGKADAEALENHYDDEDAHWKLFELKQDTLDSGQNIKTINGESILGPGDIEIIGGGASGFFDYTVEEIANEQTTLFEDVFSTNIDIDSLPIGTFLEWKFFAEAIALATNDIIFTVTVFNIGVQMGFIDLSSSHSVELSGYALKRDDGKWLVYHKIDYSGLDSIEDTKGRGRKILVTPSNNTFSLSIFCDKIGGLKFTSGYIKEVIGGASEGTGLDGVDGLSAYQIAVNNGFVGTEAEWLTSLVGADGADGADGANGADGVDGVDGESAYQIAVNNGFVGTEAEWLTSLVGADGADGADGANGADGAPGTDGVDGVDGESAYQIAVNNGFVGTEAEWLTSLVGADGADGEGGANGADGAPGTDGVDGVDGESAYQIAVNNGFVGTEAEWLTSLVGADGADGEGGAVSDDVYSGLWMGDEGAASKNAIYNRIQTLTFFGFAGSAEDGVPVNGVIYHDRVHEDFRLGRLKFSLTEPDTTATLTFDILKNGVSVMHTLATIDAGETTSETATVPYVIDDLTTGFVDFDDDDEITVVLSGTPTDAVGLKGKLIQTPATFGR